MAFGSDNFPLGPAGGYPKVRRRSYGAMLNPPVNAQDVYLSGGNTVSKMPSIEKDFNSSINKAKGRMKRGSAMRRGGRGFDYLRPRYAPTGLRGEDEYEGMDRDAKFEQRFDEGETDDSVGFFRHSRR